MEEIRPTSWYTVPLFIYMIVYIPGGAGLKLRPITHDPCVIVSTLSLGLVG